MLSILERNSGEQWRQRGGPIAVAVGRSGIGWGRGLIATRSFPGPIKKEGDDKAPAGIFRLSRVFGHATGSDASFVRMPYLALSENIVGVDDPRSRYYNQLVDKSKIDRHNWRSAEKMFGVGVYKWGVVVDHNVPPRPGAGSCIFVHIWEIPSTATSGCTAMSEKDLLNVIRWLDPGLEPLLVQLPRPIYNEQREKWGLPQL